MTRSGDPKSSTSDSARDALRESRGEASADAAPRIGALGPSLTVESPEQVQLDLELAGPMSRAFAFSIDYTVVLLLVTAGLLLLFAGSTQVAEWLAESRLFQDVMDRFVEWWGDGDAADPETQLKGLMIFLGVWMFLDLVVATLYFLVFETLFQGRTLGKRMTRLRVVTEDGGLMSWRDSLVRNLLRTVDILPVGYCIGVATMIASPRVQRLGDMAAGTLVIRERENTSDAAATVTRLAPEVEAGFQLTREEIARMGEVERRLIRRTLRRVETLPDAEAQPIVSRTTEAIALKIGREDSVSQGSERDFLVALLQAAERFE